MDGKIIKYCLVFLLALNIFPAQSQEISRHILALYDSGRGQTVKKNHIHQNAEVILNHLGCIVDYHDIADGLPDKKVMSHYRGVITWFYSNAMEKPAAYLKWASKQIAAGRKFVILGNIGAFRQRQSQQFLPIAEINTFTNKLGFAINKINWTKNPAKIELISKNSEMVEFERDLKYELSNYEHYNSVNPANKVYLKLKRKDLAQSESDLVLTTPFGGFAASGYVIYEQDRRFKQKWRINPFRFFSEAFGLKGLPRPDVTTLNGLRIWCSHIDGDAINSKSETKPDAYCGEVIRDEIIQKYKWPISVSVVVGELLGNQEVTDIARSIYEIDWVEAASHTYSHPFYWVDDYEDADQYEQRHLPLKGYKFDLKTEIIGSVDFINKNLLPEGKFVQQLFWSGNCEPPAAAIKFCKQIKIRNMNGGDTIFDRKNLSYTSVAPLGVQVGNERQIYAPNANENIYTNEWQGPYFGFKFVLETFKNTENPVRIKPINIYYHFYSGAKWASLNALKHVLKETIIQPVAPIYISQYLDIVDGFFSTNIMQESETKWRVENNGQCKTIRFDETEQRVDLENSQNVLGFNHFQDALYVHLGEDSESLIQLSDKQPNRIYLKQASHRLQNWQADENKIFFQCTGFGKGEFHIANLPANQIFRILITGASKTAFEQKSNINGVLSFLVPMAGAISVNIYPVSGI